MNTDRLVSIYCSNWDANQINEILIAFDFDTENHSFIFGTSRLILEILDKAKIKDYQVGKKRSFYKSYSVKE